MNREILSRGKRTDNGEWVEGFYWKDIWGDDTEYIYYDGESYKVIPDTVGRYTGLTEKNGKKIFEGDIVKTKKFGKIIGYVNVNGYDIFRVVYVPAVFRLENTRREFNFVGNGTDYEVIGNIYDNPELMEVQHE